MVIAGFRWGLTLAVGKTCVVLLARRAGAYVFGPPGDATRRLLDVIIFSDGANLPQKNFSLPFKGRAGVGMGKFGTEKAPSPS
jgi:hypothetical protein